MDKKPLTQTISGVLALVPNPCLTEPCVPGLAYAVVVKTQSATAVPYFLTQNGNVLLQDYVWEATAPTLDLPVTVKGVVSQHADHNNNTFLAIEFMMLSSTA